MSEAESAFHGQNIVLPIGAFRVDIQSRESIELARHRRWRDTVLFGVALSLFTTVFLVGLWAGFLDSGRDGDTRKAATAIVVTLIGALGGFLGGRAAK